MIKVFALSFYVSVSAALIYLIMEVKKEKSEFRNYVENSSPISIKLFKKVIYFLLFIMLWMTVKTLFFI